MRKPQQLAREWLQSIHNAHARDLAGEENLDRCPPALPPDSMTTIAAIQHHFNCRLWAEEDIARSTTVTDARLAAVKRRIDHLNQRRNDWIEELNERFMEELKALGTEPRPMPG